MSDRPFVILSTKDDDGVKFSDKSHKLSSNACVKEDGSNFRVKKEALIDDILISDGGKIKFAFLDENPFVLFNGKAIDEI